jgi:L-2-hydroxyglutarate oxidase LhgO
MVGPQEMREIEPAAAGVRALHSPGTGIIDFALVVQAMAADLGTGGVPVLYGHEVRSIERRDGAQVLETTGGPVAARRVISCAGLHSDRVAGLTSPTPVQIVPFRGDYYTLREEARSLCRGLIYPVPDPSLPFLGVHFTKRVDGNVWAGPNAVLATAREGYSRTDVNPADLLETLRFPGFRKLARTYWRTGAVEAWRDVVKSAFVKELQRYVPEVRSDQLTFGPSGVRAQALDADGAMVDDFRLVGDGDSMHVLNAPSPAATASLAIAAHLAGEAADLFALA